MKKSEFSGRLNAIIPLLVWLLLFMLPFMTRFGNMPGGLHNEILQGIFVSNALLMSVFYIHYYFVYPVRQIKYGLFFYTASLAVIFIVFFAIHSVFLPVISKATHSAFSSPDIIPNRPTEVELSPPPYVMFFPLVLVLMVSYFYRFYCDYVSKEKLIKERENIHLKTELAFLRSQISPHFIFNLMNTLVLMARKESKLLEPSLISLSQLMRYMLYESDGEKISLEKEVGYLRNYIDLQLLRFEADVIVNFNVSGTLIGYWIEPMLLIPFVENAFKHGIGLVTKPAIDIIIAMNNTESRFEMVVENRFAPSSKVNSTDSGIGLSNVTRRLELLYPQNHTFKVSQHDQLFTVKLQVNL